MLEFKGGGFIKINNKKIEFTNSVDSEFINFVKMKIRLNDPSEKITEVRFKLIDVGNTKSTDWIESSVISSPSTNQVGVSFERAVNQYYYVNDSETGSLTKIEMEFWQPYSGVWIKGGTATFGAISYDANDYVNEVEYHITVSTPTGSLPAETIVNRLLDADADTDRHVIPTKVRFKYADNSYGADIDLTGSQAWTFSSGENSCHITGAFTQNINHHPVEYQLRTNDNETFDSGAITLNPPVGENTANGEVPWLPGDTINFDYTTTVFN